MLQMHLINCIQEELAVKRLNFTFIRIERTPTTPGWSVSKHFNTVQFVKRKDALFAWWIFIDKWMLIVKINAKAYVEMLYYFIEPIISLNNNKLHTLNWRNYFAQIGLCKPIDIYVYVACTKSCISVFFVW